MSDYVEYNYYVCMSADCHTGSFLQRHARQDAVRNCIFIRDWGTLRDQSRSAEDSAKMHISEPRMPP